MSNAPACHTKKKGEAPAPLFKVVLTGGPCGGKSSSLAHITKAMASKGVVVYSVLLSILLPLSLPLLCRLCSSNVYASSSDPCLVLLLTLSVPAMHAHTKVPEIPTILITGGCAYPGLEGGDQLFHFETAILQAQLQLESSFEMVAKSTGKPSILLMDRALMDVAAYLPEAQWKDIVGRNGWTEEQFTGRYDLVLHLVTAADGAEEFYTTTNNSARTETVAEAVVLDKKVRSCWDAHSNRVVVPNAEGGFEAKMAAATAAVEALVAAVHNTHHFHKD